jgi:hypothetical protein
MNNSGEMEQGFRHGIDIHVPRLLNASERDLNSAMDKKHRSVIVKSGDVELIDIVSQDIKGNDYYGVASDIITSEQNRSVETQVKGSKDTLNRLMNFQKTLKQHDIMVSYTKKLSRI